MPLLPGTKLGPYEIIAPLGVGGMGEVYRARDNRLERDVAVKVLPEAFSSDAQRMARFGREAKVLASLVHPNIATIHGVEDSGIARALVMELVEGPTLAERIQSGAIPLDDALPIAKQIADALEYAHERGIVHRDLKPSNVKITCDGHVKVLDFGLAKALTSEVSSSGTDASPTLSAMATGAGFLLGTAAYMSPEQAKGKTADRRADIWSFGVVLYEMLAGKRLFSGETTSDTLAEVLKTEPDWSQFPASTPPAIRNLAQRCLKKDPRQRLQAIGDARIAIEEVQSGSGFTTGTTPMTERTRVRPSALWAAAGLIVGALATAAFLGVPSGQKAPPAPVHLNIAVPPDQLFVTRNGTNVAVSRDGTQIAYVLRRAGGDQQIWIRRLDDFSAKPVPGTEGADTPFFSPDGQWLGFFGGNKIKKTAISGGFPAAVCESAGPYGITWAADGFVYFAARTTGVLRVPNSGGQPEQFIAPDRSRGEVRLMQPEMLPKGQALLFTVSKLAGVGAEASSIAVAPLKTGKREILVQNAMSPHYVEPGYLLFTRSGTLWAVPFDVKRLKLTGTPLLTVQGIARSVDPFEHYATSENGVLVYVSGPEMGPERRVIVEVDRKGSARTVTPESRAYEDLDLSPDGQHLAATIEGAVTSVWTYDLRRSTLTKLTFDNDSRDPFWSADGKRIVYSSARKENWGLYVKAADGTGLEKELFISPNWIAPSSFSPDGRYLAFFEAVGNGAWILPLEGGGKPSVFAQSSSAVMFPAFSPDGRWIAYESNETGRPEIYVQSFQGERGKWQVSSEGGSRPVWPRNDREIFFMNGNKVMAAPVQMTSAFSAGTPHELFEGDYFTSGHHYDASPDGQHFYFINNVSQRTGPTQINIVLNWPSEIARLMRGRESQ